MAWGVWFFITFTSVSSWTPRTGLAVAVIILDRCSLARGNLCKLDPESLGHDPTSLDSFLYRQGHWITVLPQSPPTPGTSGIQRGEKVYGTPSRSASAGVPGVRTLHSLAGLCSPPQSRRGRSCLVSVNWLTRKRTACIKIQRYFIQPQDSEPLQMYHLYTILFLKVRRLSPHSHTHACAFEQETFHSAAPHHRTPLGPFLVNVEQKEVLCFPGSP